MPKVSRWFIKGALLYLFATAALRLTQEAGLSAAPPALTGLHMMWAGWLTQLAAGVALWMLPRPNKQQGWRLAWIAFVGTNAGLLLRFWAEPQEHRYALLLSALLQAVGFVALITHLWWRLSPKRPTSKQRASSEPPPNEHL